MSLLTRLDRAAAAFGLAPKAQRGRRGAEVPGWWQSIGQLGEWGNGIPDVALYAAQADKYIKTPVFYAAVNRLAEAAAMSHSVVRAGMAPDAAVLPEHPFLDLLRKPVYNMEWLSLDRFTVLESICGSLGVNGNAYLYLGSRPAGWPPTMLLPLRPDRLWPDPDRQQGLKGYQYEINGRKWPLPVGDVLHLRRWHPANDFVGLSPVEPANYAIATDLASQKHNWAVFKNGARLSAVIESDAAHVDKEDQLQMEQWWIDHFTGDPTKAHQLAFLWGGFKAKDWGINARDAEYIEGRKLNRTDMLMATGIHPGLLMAEDVNLANAKAAEYLFAKYTLRPALTRIAERFNAEILPLYGDGHTFGFENVVPRDEIIEAQTEQARGAALVELVRALGPAEGVAEAQRKGLISADVQVANVMPLLTLGDGGAGERESGRGGAEGQRSQGAEAPKGLTATEATDLAAVAEEYGRAAQLLASVLASGSNGNGRHG